MNDPRRVFLVVAVALGTLVPAVASASYPAGVWALVEKVTPEPDADQPNRVRIDGLFIVAKGTPDFAGYPGYSVPAYGYMYYQCADAELATCKMEWAELATVAGGEDRCRGWGDNSLPANGTVRTAEPQAMPDAYPISMGVVPGFSPCNALKEWMAEHPPEAATSGEGRARARASSRPRAPRGRRPGARRARRRRARSRMAAPRRRPRRARRGRRAGRRARPTRGRWAGTRAACAAPAMSRGRWRGC
ncbi:hypothetical protein [Nannocystis pusilla]|uniref:hypothetical protein n=1 Tax=Nannocystis pusilla TaxID=889268 RepID=UPI003B761D05